MKIDKNQLQEALAIVKPGLAAKELVEQSTSFAFVAGRVITYNDEISISHPVDGIEIEGAIPANELYSLLSKIEKETVTLEIGDNTIQLKAGRSKAGFVMEHEVKLPIDEVTGKKKWKRLPEGFVAALEKTVLACSKDPGRALLMCVHVNEAGFIEGCDSNRLSRISFATPFTDIPTLLIPSDSVLQVLPLTPTHIAMTEGWVHFKNESKTVFSTRILEEDTYPSTDHLLDGEAEEFITLPTRIKRILSLAEAFYKRGSAKEEVVELELTGKKAIIRAKTETDSWFEESTNCPSDNPMTFKLPPPTLYDIVDAETEIGVFENKLMVELADWQYVCALT